MDNNKEIDEYQRRTDNILQQRRDRYFKTYPFPKFIKDNELDWYESPYRKDITLETGQHFLFQVCESDSNGNEVMTYPILATFLNYTAADQALEYNFYIEPRKWEYNLLSEDDTWSGVDVFGGRIVTDSVIEWGDAVYIFGIWDKKPNWKQIKEAMRKTFYFRVSRKDKIERILCNSDKL